MVIPQKIYVHVKVNERKIMKSKTHPTEKVVSLKNLKYLTEYLNILIFLNIHPRYTLHERHDDVMRTRWCFNKLHEWRLLATEWGIQVYPAIKEFQGRDMGKI